MENQIELNVKINCDLYKKVREILGYTNTLVSFKDKDLPLTDEEIINSALFYYFEKMDTVMGFHKIYKRALNLDEGTKIKNRFKDILKMIGMKQKELAELTGIDSATLSTMLANKNQPSIEYFLRIWSVLGCPPIEEVFYREKS